MSIQLYWERQWTWCPRAPIIFQNNLREVSVYENTDLQWWTTQRKYMAANSDCKEIYSEN